MYIVRRSYDFFFDAVHTAFRHQRVPEDDGIERYLAKLLERFSRDEEQILFQPLRQKFWKLLGERPDMRLAEIREIGDASLFTAGILIPNMSRPFLGQRYYIEVGECAHRFLFFNPAEKETAAVHGRLAENLGPFVRVFKEIGRTYVLLTTIDDIVRVCERYMLRGADEDRVWLLEHGVTILPGFTDPQKRIII